MAQLRNFQLFRNQSVVAHLSHEAAIAAFKASNGWRTLKDGEILLYSYQIGEAVVEGNDIYSLIGVVRNGKLDIITNEGTLKEAINALDKTITSTNGNYVNVTIEQENGLLKSVTVDETKLAGVLDGLDFTHATTNTDNTTFKVFGTNQANGQISEVVDGTIVFDRALVTTGETQNLAATTGYVTDAINALDVTNVNVATLTDNVVEIYNVKEVDGKIAQNNKVVTLEEVAVTGAAADVSVAQKLNGETVVLPAGTVQGTLEAIAAEIDAMDLASTDVVALTENSKALQASKISEVDGKVSVEAAATIVEFNQAISSTNKVATMADLTAAEYTGEKAIAVNNDTNKISLVINPDDSVLSQDASGLKTNISLQYVSVADATGEGTHKVIQLIGTNGGEQATPVVLGTVDATDFVKDSFLESATIVNGTWTVSEGTESFTPGTGTQKAIELVWRTVTRDGDTSDDSTETTYINVESLIDAYTAGNGWIEIDPTANTISHKIQEGIVIPENASTVTTATAANGTATAAGIATITVPELTIDKAGHITKQENKSYTIDLPVTAVAQVDGQTVVTPSVNGNDTTYTVGLPVIPRVIDGNVADDNGVIPSTTINNFADDSTTFKYVTNVETDNYGRVTKIVTETMTENFDLGTY